MPARTVRLFPGGQGGMEGVSLETFIHAGRPGQAGRNDVYQENT